MKEEKTRADWGDEEIPNVVKVKSTRASPAAPSPWAVTSCSECDHKRKTHCKMNIRKVWVVEKEPRGTDSMRKETRNPTFQWCLSPSHSASLRVRWTKWEGFLSHNSSQTHKWRFQRKEHHVHSERWSYVLVTLLHLLWRTLNLCRTRCNEAFWREPCSTELCLRTTGFILSPQL